MKITFNSNRGIDFYLKDSYMTIDSNEKVLYLGGSISKKVNENNMCKSGRHYRAYMNNSPISVGLKEAYDLRENDLVSILEEVTSIVMQQNMDIHDILTLWKDDRGESLSHYVSIELEK